MEFKEFKQMQQAHFESVIDGHDVLFATDVEKDVLWETYLSSFPEGANKIYRERGEFDCSCCKQFIRAFGNVVTVKDNKLVSIWDFDPGDSKYKPVVTALSDLVKSTRIKDAFVTKDGAFGTEKNHEQLEDDTVRTWHHFRIDLPRRFTCTSSQEPNAVRGAYRDSKNVFQRSLDELGRDAVVTVLDLIAEKTLYRGDEWEENLTRFLAMYDAYHALPDDEKDNYCWAMSGKVGGAISRIRNHSIGVLLQDLTSGEELDTAVRRYEAIVAPHNYKRPKAIFTTQMVKGAEEKVNELGLLNSLGRRHAVLSDITINNVLWANRDAVQHMDGVGGVFDMLKQEVAVNPKKFDKVQGVGIDEFVGNILPEAKNLEVLVENRHSPSLVSLIAPQVADSPTLFKWDNAFSWAYNGNIADSMKQRVKAAGGKVDGVLRFSIQWNDRESNQNDYDAHCIEPSRNDIHFRNMSNPSSSGRLDVDVISPGRKVAVENITWTDINMMQEGTYKMYVHNYSHNGGRDGFDAEIEFGGQIYEFPYHKDLRGNASVTVAELEFSRSNGIVLKNTLPSTTTSRKEWGLNTNQFHPVSTFMFSPNYWDGQRGVGHKHFLFMLAGCENDTRPNGFFNEYLREEFMPHKRVFEALGAKMKVEYSTNQLSGLGFSSTKRNSLICKVDDNIIKVVF